MYVEIFNMNILITTAFYGKPSTSARYSSTVPTNLMALFTVNYFIANLIANNWLL